MDGALVGSVFPFNFVILLKFTNHQHKDLTTFGL
jgi:hypothetical protein